MIGQMDDADTTAHPMTSQFRLPCRVTRHKMRHLAYDARRNHQRVRSGKAKRGPYCGGFLSDGKVDRLSLQIRMVLQEVEDVFVLLQRAPARPHQDLHDADHGDRCRIPARSHQRVDHMCREWTRGLAAVKVGDETTAVQEQTIIGWDRPLK